MRALVQPDAETVDSLARLQLDAKRLGGSIRLRHVSRELKELIELMGLCNVLRVEEEA